MDLPYDSSRLDRLMDEAGADVLVAGSAVFGGGDYAAAINALKDAVR